MAKTIEIAQKATKYRNRFYDECKMKVTIIDSMNICQATIFGRTLLTVTTEQIQQQLSKFNCTKVERMETMRDGQRKPDGFHILTFRSRTLPADVLCGYDRFNTKQYYSNPLQCGVCCQYGHTKNWCPRIEKPVCKECVEDRHNGTP
jgi:hypothetical protein